GFPFETLSMLRAFVASPTRGFEMDEFRMRSKDIAKTLLPNLQAEIDVVVSDGQLFLVKAADGFKDFLAHDQASRADGGNGVGQLRFTHPGIGVLGFMPKEMIRHPADSQVHA